MINLRCHLQGQHSVFPPGVWEEREVVVAAAAAAAAAAVAAGAGPEHRNLLLLDL